MGAEAGGAATGALGASAGAAEDAGGAAMGALGTSTGAAAEEAESDDDSQTGG